MKKTIFAGLAVAMLLGASALSTPASAFGMPHAPKAAMPGDGLVIDVRGRGHRGWHRNRGLHRGWYIGRHRGWYKRHYW